MSLRPDRVRINPVRKNITRPLSVQRRNSRLCTGIRVTLVLAPSRVCVCVSVQSRMQHNSLTNAVSFLPIFTKFAVYSFTTKLANSTKHTRRLRFCPFAVLRENMTSSAKPEVHALPSREDRATATSNMYRKFGEICTVVFEIRERTEKEQTDIQTC